MKNDWLVIVKGLITQGGHTHTHTHTKGAKLTPAFLREIKIYFLSGENVLNALD